LLNLRLTSYWTPGDTVLENKEVKRGTVIATFYEGVYPSAASGSREYRRVGGNHAAIFWGQGTVNGQKGIWVIDQWKSRGHAGFRFIAAGTGQITDRSNDARAFSVVRTYPLPVRGR
jgi:hypothetical protein